MKVDVGTFAAEFPNDNPSLHGGALWVCRDVVGPPMVEIVERAGGSAVTALGIMPAAIIAARGPAPEIQPQYEDAELALSETAAAIARAADILSRALHIEEAPAEESASIEDEDTAAIEEENDAINALVAEAVLAAIAEVKALADAAAATKREAEARAHAAQEAEAVAAIEAMALADAEASAISAQVADAVRAAMAEAEAEAKVREAAEAAAQAEADAKARDVKAREAAEAAAQAEAEAKVREAAEAAAQAEAEAKARDVKAREAAEAAAQAEAEVKAREAAEAAAQAEAEEAERPARPSGIMLVGERATLDDEGVDELVVEELEPFAAETEIEIVALVEAPEVPLTTTASEAATILPPTSDDPFQLFVAALEGLAIAEGSPWAASVLGPLLGQGIAPAGLSAEARTALASGGVLEGDAPTAAFLGIARAWRDILRGTSEDWSACGAMMLDEWAADVLARLMGAPDRMSTLRRDLRTRGVAAFGLVEAA